MITMTSIFNAYASEYIERYPNLPPSHLKTIRAICACRTGAYGYSLYTCPSCGQPHRIDHACGNRHCPQCQHHHTQLWLQHQLDKQVPGPHFLITFTIPEPLRAFCRSHPRLAYQSLFQASSEALKKLARDERLIGTDLPGFTGVLPTWGRQLQYHPHIHYLVPGGGLSKPRDQWRPSNPQFYVPVRALSPIYRALFKAQITQAGYLDPIEPQVWKTPWNVHSQATPGATTSLKYLAPYVFKVAISNRRLVSLKNRIVTFTFRKPGSNRLRSTRLEVIEFIRRFLQHVLPTGFVKVRHFGFMNANCTVTITTIRGLIAQQNATPAKPPQATTEPVAQWPCPHCGAPLQVVMRVWHGRPAVVDTG